LGTYFNSRKIKFNKQKRPTQYQIQQKKKLIRRRLYYEESKKPPRKFGPLFWTLNKKSHLGQKFNIGGPGIWATCFTPQ